MNELAIRTATGLAMVAGALIAASAGDPVWPVLVAVIATAMFWEWTRITRGWGLLWYMGGFFYAVLPAVALLWVRDRTLVNGVPSAEQGLKLLMWVFIVTWATDTGAYFAGRKFGRRKLAPLISPKKTVEGLSGGIAAAALLGGGWVLAIGLAKPLLAAAPIFAVAAQAGDLFESGLKRRAGVKDSSNLLPGHGGVLDRLDGLVPVAVLTALLQLGGLA